MNSHLSASFAVLVLLAALAASPVSSQTLHTEVIQIESAVLGRTLSQYVCVPSDYDDHPDRRYSVLYDFAGGDGSSSDLCSWWSEIIDNMEMDPFIVIRVEGRVGLIGGDRKWTADIGLWTNSEVSGRWEDYVMDEVVPYMDSTYRTLAEPLHRVAHGGSGGGYPAALYTLKRPDVFGSGVTSVGVNHDLLGFCDPYTTNPYVSSSFRQLVLSENSGPPYDYRPEAGGWTHFLFSMSAAWSPNVDNPPYLVDLPYDADGNPIPEVCDRWMQHSPSALVSGLDAEDDVYFSLGLWTRDELGAFDKMTRVLMDSLDAYGVPYDTQSQPCGHGVTCPDGLDYTVFREKHWHLNNLIRRGALTISRDPAMLIIPKRGSLNFGVVRSLPAAETLRLYNYGPGEYFVPWSLNTSPSLFVPRRGFVYIAEGDSSDVQFFFAPTESESGTETAQISLIHGGVGIKTVSLRAFNRVEGVGVAAERDELAQSILRFDVFPSPSAGSITVRFETATSEQREIAVFDMLGRKVAVLTNGPLPAGRENTLRWDTSAVPAGMYIVRLQLPTGTIARSVIVER